LVKFPTNGNVTRSTESDIQFPRARESRVFDAIFATIALRVKFPFQVRGWDSNWYSRMFFEARSDRCQKCSTYMREEKAKKARGCWYVVIVVQLLQFIEVCKFQSDYQHYTSYPCAIAVHINNWAGMEGEENQSPAMQTTENNMSNCTMHNTRINTCSWKAIVLLYGRIKWYDFVAMLMKSISHLLTSISNTLSYFYYLYLKLVL